MKYFEKKYKDLEANLKEMWFYSNIFILVAYFSQAHHSICDNSGGSNTASSIELHKNIQDRDTGDKSRDGVADGNSD